MLSPNDNFIVRHEHSPNDNFIVRNERNALKGFHDKQKAQCSLNVSPPNVSILPFQIWNAEVPFLQIERPQKSRRRTSFKTPKLETRPTARTISLFNMRYDCWYFPDAVHAIQTENKAIWRQDSPTARCLSKALFCDVHAWARPQPSKAPMVFFPTTENLSLPQTPTVTLFEQKLAKTDAA